MNPSIRSQCIVSDTGLETVCISGTRPPYKRPTLVIDQVGREELHGVRAQIAQSRDRRHSGSSENRRPKSTPGRLNVGFSNSPRTRFSRWRQVYSARDRNSLEREHDDAMTIMLSPGYILSRGKEKINVTIKTDFFKEDILWAKSRKKSQPLDEKDNVIQQLRQQIDDLTLFLEEERLNHKIKNKKTAENHQLVIEQIRKEHREHVKSVEDDHNEEIEKLKSDFDQQLQEQRRVTEVEKARLVAKMETLQGAFEAYKETVAAEMNYRWQRRVKELRDESDRHTEDELAKQKRVMLYEKSKEIDIMNKEFQRQIQVLVEDHKKEVDHLMEKFAECAQDSEQLKSALLEMQTLKQQREELANKLKTKTEVLTKTQMELEDKSVKLAAFEKHFAEKVEEVDNRYSLRMQGLMSDNTELRRHYIKKCEQVFRLKTEKETEQENAVRSVKDALQVVILSRTKCDVSLTALRNEIPNAERVRPGMGKDRPMSAPSTREELAKAEQLTAAVTESPFVPAELPVQETSKPRPHTSHDSNLYSPRTTSAIARSGIRESLIPTPLNVLNQGIQDLPGQRQF